MNDKVFFPAGEFTAVIEPTVVETPVAVFHSDEQIIESDVATTPSLSATIGGYLDDRGYDEPRVQTQLRE